MNQYFFNVTEFTTNCAKDLKKTNKITDYEALQIAVQIANIENTRCVYGMGYGDKKSLIEDISITLNDMVETFDKIGNEIGSSSSGLIEVISDFGLEISDIGNSIDSFYQLAKSKAEVQNV